MRFDLLHILFHVDVMFYFLSSSFKSTEYHMNAVLRVYSYYHRVPRQHFRDMNILKKKKFPDPCNWFLPVNMAKFAPTSFAMFNLFIAPSVPPYYYYTITVSSWAGLYTTYFMEEKRFIKVFTTVNA